MYELNRETAIRWLSQYEMARMDESGRLDCLCGLWYRPENEEYHMLSEELQQELDNMDDFTDVMHLKWNPIILEYLITYEHRGDSNTYLKSKLLQMGLKDEFNVVGEPIAPMHQCECCNYLVPSLVCSVCEWCNPHIKSEYDASIPNRGLTLEQAKENFERSGNCYDDPAINDRLKLTSSDRFIRFQKPTIS